MHTGFRKKLADFWSNWECRDATLSRSDQPLLQIDLLVARQLRVVIRERTTPTFKRVASRALASKEPTVIACI